MDFDAGLDTARKLLIVFLLVAILIIIITSWLWLLGKADTTLPSVEPSGTVTGMKGINEFIKLVLSNLFHF